MLEEVFIIIELSVYFDFNKNMKTKRKTKWRRSYNHFLYLKLPITFLFPSRFLSTLYQNVWF